MGIEPPEENGIDKIIPLAKAIVALIPGAAIGSELLFSFIKTPYQKRVNEWQEEISETLNELKDKTSFETLQNDKEFLDILLQAVQVGIRQHQEEKRKALKNAIVHSVTNPAIDFNLKLIFINYIDIFTVWHIKLLGLLAYPYKTWKKYNSNTEKADDFRFEKYIDVRENIIKADLPDIEMI